MNNRTDNVWQSPEIVQKYLGGVRGAIPLATEQIKVMIRLVTSRQQTITRFLDLGSGDGILAGVLLDQYPTAAGTLLDFSPPMIDAAREKLAPFAPQLTFVTADYADPTWVNMVIDNAPFDVIVSGYSIHHQPDRRKRSLYTELFDLLAPGGIFVNIEHVASATPWGESLWDDCFVDGLVDMYRQQGQPRSRAHIHEIHQNSDERAANILATAEDQCDWLREIGFEDVDCFFKYFELAVFAGCRPRK